MGGSGGSFTFSRNTPSDLQQQIRSAELEVAYANFGPVLAECLNGFLSRINDRDAVKTQSRLDNIKVLLRDELEESFDLRFGGSVAKHTYVDGLSDVDALLILRGSSGKTSDPDSLLSQIAAKLGDELPRDVSVSKGRMAVTLLFPDAEEIQLVPAMRKGGKLHVPAWTENEWSRIDPTRFERGLIKRNEECNGKLIPTIKLAKAINDTLPEAQKLSGYHIESLAISAFKDYPGKCVIEKMLSFFFARMSQLVRAPIKDSTGQSVHVDQYLGRAQSPQRQQLSHVLDRIARRMENATAASSLEQWKALFNG